MYTIYKIENRLNGKIYIGATIQPVQTRWYKHRSDAKRYSSFPLYTAMLKDGIEVFRLTTIEEGEDHSLKDEREIYWVKELDCINPDIGYNVSEGGKGSKGRKCSEETKKKISEASKNRKPTKDKRPTSGYKQTEEVKQKITASNKERWTPEMKDEAKSKSATNKSIQQFDLKGNFIKEFISASAAARELGIQRENISKCLRGLRNKAGAFIWKYNIDGN